MNKTFKGTSLLQTCFVQQREDMEIKLNTKNLVLKCPVDIIFSLVLIVAEFHEYHLAGLAAHNNKCPSLPMLLAPSQSEIPGTKTVR